MVRKRPPGDFLAAVLAAITELSDQDREEILKAGAKSERIESLAASIRNAVREDE